MNKVKAKKKKPVSTNNFLEKLRELGGGLGKSVAQDVIEGIPSTALNQIMGKKRTGTLKPNETLSLEEIKEREQTRQRLSKEFFQIRQEERLIFKQEEQQTRLQIKAIQEELKKLAISTEGLAREVEIAAKLEPVKPGVYHLNFFERLKQAIVLFRKKIEKSATWLSLFNQRAKKRSYYWAQFHKSGTKFMLSAERYTSTSTG